MRGVSLAAIVLASSLASLTACTEPTDCAVEPQRCITPPVSAAGAKPAAAEVGKPVQVLPERRQRPVAAQPAPGGPVRRLPEVAPQAAPSEGETADAAWARGVIVGLRSAAAAHDMAALQKHMTKRLTADLLPKLDKYAERLWKHLDRYVKAVDGGKFTVLSEPADTATRRQVTITLPDGGELKPILEREDNVWKVDRF